MNLVDEFFKRNLTEPEAEALDHLLEQSPEEASRFAQRAEQEYFSLGLPAPQLPAHLIPPLVPAGLSPLLSTLLAGGFLSVAAMTWWFWPTPKPVLLAPSPARESVPMPKAALPAAVPVKEALTAPPPAIPEPVTTATREGNRLNVVVDLDNPAPVKVGVFDPQGRWVRTLYAGNLAAGRWALRWDGKLADGSRAPAGEYQIEVESGSHRMVRAVSLAPPP